MNIEFDGPVSSANATLIRQVIEALIQRILARDGDLDINALDRIVVADESTAHATARAEIQQVANGIATRIGPGGGDLGDAAVRQTVDELLEASGIGAVADSIRRAASRPAGGALAHPEPPATVAWLTFSTAWP